MREQADCWRLARVSAAPAASSLLCLATFQRPFNDWMVCRLVKPVTACLPGIGTANRSRFLAVFHKQSCAFKGLVRREGRVSEPEAALAPLLIAHFDCARDGEKAGTGAPGLWRAFWRRLTAERFQRL